MTKAGRERHLWKGFLAATLVGASLLLANLHGFKGGELLDGTQYLNHGWPSIYLARCRWRVNFSGSEMEIVEANRWLFDDNDELVLWWNHAALYVNLTTAAILVGCTFFTVVFPGESTSFPRQVTLRELLITMTLASVFMSLTRMGSLYSPLVTWKPLVFFPILLGIVSVAVALNRVLSSALHFAGRAALLTRHKCRAYRPSQK